MGGGPAAEAGVVEADGPGAAAGAPGPDGPEVDAAGEAAAGPGPGPWWRGAEDGDCLVGQVSKVLSLWRGFPFLGGFAAVSVAWRLAWAYT